MSNHNDDMPTGRPDLNLRDIKVGMNRHPNRIMATVLTFEYNDETTSITIFDYEITQDSMVLDADILAAIALRVRDVCKLTDEDLYYFDNNLIQQPTELSRQIYDAGRLLIADIKKFAAENRA